MDVWNFYSVSDEFGQFSNFAPFPITIGGERWPTSEHYFQAQKFQDKAYRQKIQRANSPMRAARLGRDRKQKLRRDARCSGALKSRAQMCSRLSSVSSPSQAVRLSCATMSRQRSRCVGPRIPG